MSRIIREADAPRDSRLLREFAASGISVGCANTFLNPVEVVKTRMQLAGAGNASTAAAVAANPTPTAAHSSSSGSSFLKPSYARFMSHTTSGVSTPATAAGATANPTLNHLTNRPWIIPQPSAAAAAAAAAAPAAAAEDALAASLRSAAETANAAAAAPRRPGFLATAGIIYRQDGLTGFTRGIQASAARAVCNGGIRLGLYDPIKTLMSADGSGRDLHVGQKLAAGSISGGIGAVLTTPMELCKTRLQAPGAHTRSMSEVVKSVIKQQGALGLWSGATPSVLRLIMLNGSMCGTYDEVKTRITRLTGWTTGVKLVLSSSMVAGVVTTTVINPADVCRAYMQTGRGKSLLGVAQQIYKREGPAGFMKGWTAAYARTGPQTLIIFTVSEIVRPLFGLNVIGAQ